jgi:hypothetical protein
MSRVVTRSITAANQFTDAIRLTGLFDLSVAGTFAATVTVQRSYDNATWRDVDVFTSEVEMTGTQGEMAWYRVGVKTGEFTSASDLIVTIAGNSGIDYTPTR